MLNTALVRDVRFRGEHLEEYRDMELSVIPAQSTPVLVIDRYRGLDYNIVRFGLRYYAIAHRDGAFSFERIARGEMLEPYFVDDNLKSLLGQLDAALSDRIAAIQQSASLHPMNQALRRADLFQPGNELLFLMTDSPPTTCNYRCPYCFFNDKTQGGMGFLKLQPEYELWAEVIQTAVAKIQRPLMLSIGPRGEALAIPPWWDLLRKLCALEKVRSVAFVSNLSLPIAPHLTGIDLHKIGLTATLHPSQYRDPERDFNAFFGQVSWLREHGVRVVVNYVLTPDQIPHFHIYRARFREIGVTMTANLFRGTFNGKLYPDSFTSEELRVAREYLKDVPYIYEYQSHAISPYGHSCTAGRALVFLENDGAVFNCNFARERLGSIYDDQLFVFDENCQCSSTRCECKWTIPLQEEFVHDYVAVGNIHEFRRRPPGEIGVHPFR